MADAKITALTELTSADGADLLPVVDDVAGTPTTKKITLTNVAAWLATLTQTLVSKTFTSPIFQGVLSGWTNVTDSWSYASATTITVPSGAAAIYALGDYIKIVQSSTTKYLQVIGIADTVLTVTGGNDYTVANSAISGQAYSHYKPVDFPGYFNITVASWATSGTAFTNAPTTPLLRMVIRERNCWIWGVFLTNATSGGTGIFKATITSNQIPNRQDNSLGNAMNLSNTALTGVCYISNTNEISIQKWDATQLAANNAYFDISMWYMF